MAASGDADAAGDAAAARRAPSDQAVAPIMVDGEGQAEPIQDAAETETAHADAAGSNGEDDNASDAETHGDGDRRRRRRGRRGGRRNRRDRETGVPPSSDGAPMEADAEAAAIYAAAFNPPDAQEFYSFLRSLDVMRAAFEKDTTAVISTNSDLGRMLKSMTEAVAPPKTPH